MRAGIHPVYDLRTFHCYGCNSEWTTRTTLQPGTSDGKIHLDICSSCHPFFTGKQKLIDKAGRVDRFRRRYAKNQPAATAGSGEATETAGKGEATETAGKGEATETAANQ